MTLPPNHPQRFELNDEVHARPPEALVAPLRLSYLALLADPEQRAAHWTALTELARQQGVAPPQARGNHYSESFGAFRLKAERHTEFTRFTVVAPGLKGAAESFASPASAALPEGWAAGLPGQLIVAVHLVLERSDGSLDQEEVAQAHFSGNAVVGSAVSGGTAVALTDLRIHADGFSRFLVLDRGMAPRQAGRVVQRLLEIETYRMMALLALPLAREVTPVLTGHERELARIAAAMAAGGGADEEVLDRLTRLEAEISRREADHHYRFSASRAYDDLVRRRIAELREQRLPGLQTFAEFMDRRLAPAMNTCASVAGRLASLAQRVAQATQLLATRVAVARERQNQAVLETMNRRVALQLRLQQTVEGLSVAAITYYVVGLVGYLAKGLAASGVRLNPELVQGISIPLALLVTGYGVHRLRQRLTRHGKT